MTGRPRITIAAWPADQAAAWTAWSARTSLASADVLAAAWDRWLVWTRAHGHPSSPAPATVAAYFAALATTLPAATAATYLRRVAKAATIVLPGHDWRWMKRTVSQWRQEHCPQRRPPSPPGPSRPEDGTRGLPLEAWPDPCRRAWEAALAPPPALGPRERLAARRATRAALLPTDSDAAEPAPGRRLLPPSAWRPATTANIKQAIGLWLRFCRDRDRPDRPDPDGVAAWVGALEGRQASGYTIRNYIRWLAQASHVLWPDGDWRWLAEDGDVLGEDLVPKRCKTPKLATLTEVWTAACRLMEAAERDPHALLSAYAYKAGLMLALLCFRPLRLSNLCEMRVGEHVIMDGDGDTPIRLEFVRTKKGRREWDFPTEILSAWHRYWTWWRPQLPGADRDAAVVWPSRTGSPVRPGIARAHLTDSLERVLGTRTNPHLLRDILATCLVEEGHAESAMHLLGHKGLASLKPYIETALTKRAAARARAAVRHAVTATISTRAGAQLGADR